MNIINDKIAEYAEKHTTPESAVLQELNRATHLKVLMPQMLSGHLQGRVLSMFIHMLKPKRILEIGTYTGYSAICMAEGLAEDGMLHTIDINEELADMCRKYFKEAGVAEKIIQHTGNALNIIPEIKETFDLVFIDADKINYINYYNMVFPKVNKGGFIIADNVLWSGRVLDEKKDKDTKALVEYSDMVYQDNRVETLLLTVRDGLMIARKK